MDLFNLDIWKQQWEVLVSAPYIVLPAAAIAGCAGWWLCWTRSEGVKARYEAKIIGLDGRITVLEERLKFAAEKVASANEAKDDVLRQFRAYKEEVAAANAGNSTLAALWVKLDTAIGKLSVANRAVGSALGIADVMGIGDALSGTVIRADKDSRNDDSP